MKNDPYLLMLNGSTIGEIVAAILTQSDSELSELASNLNDGQLVSILNKASTAYRKREVRSMLITGAILYSISIATGQGSKKEMFDLLVADMEISINQAYRCKNAYRYFGKPLLRNEKLQQAFVVESLKLLSEPRVTEEAREESLKLAERGERITIKKAKALIAPSKPSNKNKPGKRRPPRKRPTLIAKFKSLVQKVADEFQKPNQQLENEELTVLIDQLEGLLGQLKAKTPTDERSLNKEPAHV